MDLPLQVMIDINWRPVFFEEEKKAKAVIFPYVEQGDILKMSDEEAEWLYNVPRDTALHQPEKVPTANPPSREHPQIAHDFNGCNIFTKRRYL